MRPAPRPGRDVAIFESYGWVDAREIAQRLKASLEEAGYDVWIDRENLRPDDEHFWLALEGALNQCTLVVALLSPHSVRLEGEATASPQIGNGVDAFRLLWRRAITPRAPSTPGQT